MRLPLLSSFAAAFVALQPIPDASAQNAPRATTRAYTPKTDFERNAVQIIRRLPNPSDANGSRATDLAATLDENELLCAIADENGLRLLGPASDPRARLLESVYALAKKLPHFIPGTWKMDGFNLMPVPCFSSAAAVDGVGADYESVFQIVMLRQRKEPDMHRYAMTLNIQKHHHILDYIGQGSGLLKKATPRDRAMLYLVRHADTLTVSYGDAFVAKLNGEEGFWNNPIRQPIVETLAKAYAPDELKSEIKKYDQDLPDLMRRHMFYHFLLSQVASNKFTLARLQKVDTVNSQLTFDDEAFSTLTGDTYLDDMPGFAAHMSAQVLAPILAPYNKSSPAPQVVALSKAHSQFFDGLQKVTSADVTGTALKDGIGQLNAGFAGLKAQRYFEALFMVRDWRDLMHGIRRQLGKAEIPEKTARMEALIGISNEIFTIREKYCPVLPQQASALQQKTAPLVAACE